MRSLNSLLLTLVLFAFGQAAMGQSSVNSDSVILLPGPVYITAHRMETEVRNTTQAVSLLDSDELRRLSPMSTPDALAAMAGVWMQKTNQGGGSPFIRGLTGYHTLLLVDGIRFNNSTFRSGPNQYLSTLDPFTLDLVEVLRGSGSVQYGSDALGGVAQLFSRTPEFSKTLTASGRILTRYTSHDMEYTARAEAEIASHGFSMLGGISYNRFGNIKAGGSLGTLTPTSFDQNSWDLKAKTRLGKATLTAAWQRLVQHDVPLYHQLVSGAYSRYHFDPQRRDLGYLRLESNQGTKAISKLRATFAYLNSLEVREKQRTGSDILRKERDNIDTWHGAIEIVSEFTPAWSASSGIEYYLDQIHSITTEYNETTALLRSARGLYPDGATYHNAALFSMHSIELHRLNVTAGARYNFVRLGLTDPVFGKTIVNPDALVGHLGAVYRIGETLYAVGSAGTGFRAPNVNDVASFGVADYRYEVPNYDLGPEKSFQYQAGIRWLTSKWRGEIHVYRNELSNLITNVPAMYQGLDSLDGAKVYRKENINKARVQGIEGEVIWQPHGSLSAFANITYTIGNNTTRSEPLSRIPPLFGMVGTDVRLGRSIVWRVESTAATKQDRLSGGDKSDSRIKTGGTPGWVAVNSRLEYAFQRFTINAGIRNIFNTAYRIHGSGVDAPGRNVWVSLDARIAGRRK